MTNTNPQPGQQAAAQQAAAAPTVIYRNLQVNPFLISDFDHISLGKEWENWYENLEMQFRFFKITEAQDKKDALIIYGGGDIHSKAQ